MDSNDGTILEDSTEQGFGYVYGPVVADDSTVFVHSAGKGLVKFPPDSVAASLWSSRPPESVGTGHFPPLSQDGQKVYAFLGKFVYSLDASDGTVLWTSNHTDRNDKELLLSNDGAHLYSTDSTNFGDRGFFKIRKLAESTGVAEWMFSIEGHINDVLSVTEASLNDDGAVLFHARGKTLYAFDTTQSIPVTCSPSMSPSSSPSGPVLPTNFPSKTPTALPTQGSTPSPTSQPTISAPTTISPTLAPTLAPTTAPPTSSSPPAYGGCLGTITRMLLASFLWLMMFA